MKENKELTRNSKEFSGRGWFILTALLTVVIILIVFCIIKLQFGSLVRAKNYFSGQYVSFELDKSYQSPDKNTVSIIVSNDSAKQVVITGAKTECKCGTINNLPVTVLPYSTASITFIVSEDADRQVKSKELQRIVFFVDMNGTNRVLAELPIFDFLVRH